MPTIKKSVRRPWEPERKVQGRRRFSNNKFYTSTRWRKLRQVKLGQQPLCEECFKHNIITEGNIIDHIVPINKGGEPLDIDNLQTMCSRCHNIKSGKEAHE